MSSAAAPDDGPPPPSDELPATLTVSDPRDLVALVPYRLGYRPTDSLVLLCLRGEATRVGLVMRVDLPADGDLATVVTHLAGHATGDGASAAVAVVYRQARVPAGSVEVVSRVLAAHGVVLRDAWQVGSERYWSLSCGDPGCCPPGGWSLHTLDATLVSAELVARGQGVVGSRRELAGDLRPVDGARVARVAALALGRSVRRPRADSALARWRAAGLETWRTAAHGGSGNGQDLSEPAAARILAVLTDPMARDAVLLDCVPGAAPGADELATGVAGAAAEAGLDSVFCPDSAVAPDEQRLRRSDEALRSLVRQGSGSLRAAPLGLLAWSAWWSGDGGRGAVLVDLALEADPTHRLALLIASALDAGMAPGWAEQARLTDAGARRGPPRRR